MTSESLAVELKAIRRGMGLYHPSLSVRIGPALRQASGVLDADPPEVVRGKVITRIRDASASLTDELTLAGLAALGVHPEVRHLTQLQDRIDWLAGQLHRDARTARRRVDEACGMLAEFIVTGQAGHQRSGRPGGWYVESAQTVMILDRDPPAALERRVIVAEQDGLDQIVLSRTVPPAGTGKPELHARMIFGGVLGLKEWDTATRFRLVLDLPRTLRAGDRHEYSIAWLQPPDLPMRPHYVLFPVVRVDHFDLHVRFGRQTPPGRVWRVADSFHRDLDEPPLDLDELSLDRAYEVQTEFTDLAPGHGYGVRWT